MSTRLKPRGSFRGFVVLSAVTETSISIVDEETGQTLILQTPPIFMEDDVESISLVQHEDTGEILQVTLSDAAGERLRVATLKPGGHIAIVADDQLISAPGVNAGISKDFQLAGDFSPEELKNWFQPCD